MKRKSIIIILKNNFRINAYNNFKNLKYTKDYKIKFFVGNHVKFLEPFLYITSFLLKRTIYVYNDYEFVYRKKSKRIVWNYPLNKEIDLSPKTFFVCKPFLNLDYKNILFYPVNCKFPSNFIPEIVYFGEVDITKISIVTKNIFYNFFYNSKNNNIFPVQNILNNYLNNVEEKQTDNLQFYTEIQNLLRFEGIKLIDENFSNFILVGDDWINYGLNARKTNHDPIYRKNIYLGRICVDFGSKSGTNSLFPRSIEIIESGGILLQSFQIDSQEIFGFELCELVVFKNFEDMIEKINNIISNQVIFKKIVQLYKERFINTEILLNNQLNKLT